MSEGWKWTDDGKSIYLDELVVKDDLSKYKAHKWYGGFKDKDGNLVKLEGEYNE